MNERSDDEVDPLGPYRPYLLVLARLQLDEDARAKLDASDLVQQSMLEAHQALAGFRGKTDAEMAAWLRQILARNLTDELRKLRRQKRDIQLEVSLYHSLQESAVRMERWIASENPTPSNCAIANEQLVRLAGAIMQLPEDQRRAVEMHHLQGFSSAVVARQLGRSEVAIAGLLRRGLKTLREAMKER